MYLIFFESYSRMKTIGIIVGQLYIFIANYPGNLNWIGKFTGYFYFYL